MESNYTKRIPVIPKPALPEPERGELIKLNNGQYIVPEGVIYHKGVYYDYTTTNTDFLILVKDLKNEGIKYNYWCLALYDLELYGVDPYADDLTDEQVNRIIVECFRNPWYYLREVCRIPTPGGSPVKCKINRATAAVIFLFLLGIDSYITIARQIGKTVTTLGLLSWVYVFGTSNTQFMFMHMTREKAAENLSSMKKILDTLPSYMDQKKSIDFETGKVKTSTDNVYSVCNVFNGNKIITVGQQTSAEKAASVARGLSQTVQFLDEFEFINFIKEVLAVSGPAYVSASETAEANGAMHGRIFSSTAGDLDTRSGIEAQEILSKTMRFDEKMYDIYHQHGKKYLQNIVNKNSIVGIVYIEYPYYLLGKDDDWYFMMYQKSAGNKLRFRREILLQRIHGSSESPFDQEDLAVIYENRKTPIESVYIMDLYKFDIYRKLNPKHPYFIGVDPSDGTGIDNFALVITDPYKDDEVVATLASPYMNPLDQPKVIQYIATKYVRQGPIGVERNKGASLIASLQYSYLRPRLYSSLPEEEKSSPQVMDRQGHLIRETRIRKELGIWTGARSRNNMMGLLSWYVKEYKLSFVDPNLISEIMTLIIKNGKIQASAGNHDDYIFAYLMALYMKHYGKNLAAYGFVKGRPVQMDADDYDYSKMTLEDRDKLYNELPDDIREKFPKPLTGKDYNKKVRQDYDRARRKVNLMYGEYRPKDKYEGSGDDIPSGVDIDAFIPPVEQGLPQEFWDEIYSHQDDDTEINFNRLDGK